MKLGPFLAIAIATCGLPSALCAQKPPTQPRAVTIDDLFQLREVRDPQYRKDIEP